MIYILYIKAYLFALLRSVRATWRNGYAEDCKSFYSSSILDVASIKLSCFILLKMYVSQYSSVAQLVEQLTVNQLVAGSSPARGAKTINKFSIFRIINNKKV